MVKVSSIVYLYKPIQIQTTFFICFAHIAKNFFSLFVADCSVTVCFEDSLYFVTSDLTWKEKEKEKEKWKWKKDVKKKT